MEDYKVINSRVLEKGLDGYSLFSDREVYIFAEQTVEYDGKILEQWLYNIKGYKCENGHPFVSLKANIIIL